MNKVAQDLRDVVSEIRRRPYPLSDLIPLLQRAADTIDELEYDIKHVQDNDLLASCL